MVHILKNVLKKILGTFQISKREDNGAHHDFPHPTIVPINTLTPDYYWDARLCWWEQVKCWIPGVRKPVFRESALFQAVSSWAHSWLPISTHLLEQSLHLQFWTTDYSIHSILSFLCVFNLLFYLVNMPGILIIPINGSTVRISLANCICSAQWG